MSARKCVIVIAGLWNDSYFGHACFVAENLTKWLPNFHFKKVSKDALEWKSWLHETCAVRGWSHLKSPLIWKEIGISGTKLTYVGGTNQFWQLLHDYYNITSNLTKSELEALKLDVLYMHSNEIRSASSKIRGERRQITIIGAGRSLCPDLVPQLITTMELCLPHGVFVSLYDEPGCFFKLKRIVKDIEAVGGGLHAAAVIQNISDGLSNSDILIYLDALCREDCEDTYNWLNRNYNCMEKLAQQINEHAPVHMKIIFCSMGPTCFYANILHSLLTKISKDNIVAVSSHYGLEMEYDFVNSVGLSIKDFGCPPIWGYLGISQFVDASHIVQKHDMYRPNKRALTATESTTLPVGIKRSELRWFFYMSHNKNPYQQFLQRKAISYYQVGRAEDFQKCKAICDLLKLWYSNEGDVGDEIISLGICSDGTFGIPKGLFFSQPAVLTVLENKTRVWKPCTDFPLPNMPLGIFKNLILTALHINMQFIKSEKKHQFKKICGK